MAEVVNKSSNLFGTRQSPPSNFPRRSKVYRNLNVRIIIALFLGCMFFPYGRGLHSSSSSSSGNGSCVTHTSDAFQYITPAEALACREFLQDACNNIDLDPCTSHTGSRDDYLSETHCAWTSCTAPDHTSCVGDSGACSAKPFACPCEAFNGLENLLLERNVLTFNHEVSSRDDVNGFPFGVCAVLVAWGLVLQKLLCGLENLLLERDGPTFNTENSCIS